MIHKIGQTYSRRLSFLICDPHRDEALGEALKAAIAVPDESMRIDTLLSLSPRLPMHMQDEAQREAFAAASGILEMPADTQAWVFVKLALKIRLFLAHRGD